ncbi:MAG: hypothetical protein FD174_2569 [Geobacteraceae bacterium]|nr:MAG: hypothetical protein FD174_2569 [Geobacteraceae bacterium]
MTFDEVVKDRDFQGLPFSERRKVLLRVDRDFARLPQTEQNKVLAELKTQPFWQGGGNTRTVGNPNASPEETERMRREFVAKEGSTGTRIKEGAKNVVKAASPYIRPVLEGGGAVGGGIVGSGAGPVVGTVAGAALGYAAGKNVADTIDEAVGLRDGGDMTNRMLQTVADVETGATLEMGGQAAAKGISTAWTGAKRLKAKGLPFSNKRNATRAGEQLIDERTPSAVAEEQTARRAEETAGLAKRTGIKAPTYAQSTGDTKAAAFEQSMTAKNGDLADRLHYQDAGIKQQGLAFLDDTFKGSEGIDDVVKGVEGEQAQLAQGAEAAARTARESADNIRYGANPQESGKAIIDALDEAVAPVKETERQLWGEVPNYPMPTQNITTAIKDLNQQPMERSVRATIDSVTDYIESLPKTTQGLQAAERTINGRIQEALRGGRRDIAYELDKLKSAVASDFDDMALAAEKGDVAIHDGQIVYPSRLQSEMDDLGKRIVDEQTRMQGVPDVRAISKALTAKGVPAMRQPAESEAAYTGRMVKEYQRQGLGDVPMQNAGVSKHIEGMSTRTKQIQDMLDNLQPAEDVAAKYTAAKRFSKEQKFDRFGRGAVKDVLSRGDEITGLKTTLDAIPSRFFQTGKMDAADDLVRAVGKDKARTLIKDYAAHDLINSTSVNGELQTSRVYGWVQKNRNVLDKYGLTDEFMNVATAQKNADVAHATLDKFNRGVASKVLGNDVEKVMEQILSGKGRTASAQTMQELLRTEGIRGNKAATKGVQNAFKDFFLKKIEMNSPPDVMGNPFHSQAKAKDFINKYMPAMEVLYKGESQKIQALKDYHAILETLSRNKNVSYSKNSTTVEKINGAQIGKDLAGGFATLGVVVSGKGWVFSAAKNIFKGMLSPATKYSQEQVNGLLKEAIVNPDVAETLMTMARKGMSDELEKRVNSHMMTLGLYGTKRAAEAVFDEKADDTDWSDIGPSPLDSE